MSATLSSATPLPGPRERSVRLGVALVNVLLGPVALTLLATMVYVVLSGTDSAFDFRHAYWMAGQRVLHGRSPYSWTPQQLREGLAFVYPALSALVFAPLALMSRDLGSIVFTFLTLAAVPGTLWIMRVRDWRVYGLAFAWLPVFSAWQTANESLLLAFGLACVWRWRDRPLVVGLASAVLISLKPMMWPLGLWLLATRRWRAGGAMVAGGLAINAVAWSAIGFDQVRPFLHATGVDTSDSWRKGYGIPALAAHLGAGREAGFAAMLLLTVGLAIAVFRLGFVRRDELRALTLTIALAFCSSPLVWGHYFTMLLVPMALSYRRLAWIWALPLLAWVCPPGSAVHEWQALIVCGSVGLTVALLMARRDRASEHAAGFQP